MRKKIVGSINWATDGAFLGLGILFSGRGLDVSTDLPPTSVMTFFSLFE